MIKFVIYLFILFDISYARGTKDPFKDLKYNKVIAYDYNGYGAVPIIDKNGELAKRIVKQSTLTKEQISSIHKTLSSNSTYGGSTAACFDPHLGLVYYLDDKVVAHISICLECNYLKSSFVIPATEYHEIKLSDDDSYSARGFSKTGRKQINKLCTELNFSHCVNEFNSMFDE